MAFLSVENTITQKTIIPGLTDLVFKSGPTMAYVKKNCLEKMPLGPSWQENFLYGMQPVDGYTPGDTHTISQEQLFTGGEVRAKYYVSSVAAIREKIQIELAGKHQVFNYIDALMQATALSMSAKLATDIFRHGQDAGTGVSASRSKLINGLDEALCDGATAGPFANYYPTYLGLTRNDTNIGEALNAPKTAANGVVAGNVGGSISYPVLEQAQNSVVYGTEQPNLMVTTNKGMSYIKMAFQAQQRFAETTLDLGFTGVKFGPATIFQDRYAPGSASVSAVESAKLGISALSGETIWILNTKYIKFWVCQAPEYSFGFSGFYPDPVSSLVVGHYKFVGNLTVQAPRYMRVLWGITG
jgi:hypothetical protein